MENNKIPKAKFKPVAKNEPNIGVEYQKALVKLLAQDEAIAGTLDSGLLNSFRSISDSREHLYSMYDDMSRDVIISSALELYADNATIYNDSGDVIWAESDDVNIQKFVNNLLTTLKLDQNAWQHIHSLVKYGDLYLETFRKSEFEEESNGQKNLVSNTKSLTEDVQDKSKVVLVEDVIVNIYKDKDRLNEYIEVVTNPAEIYELTKRGKTVGYLKTKINKPSKVGMLYQYSVDYNLSSTTQDIQLYDPTKYVHIFLPDTSNRSAEEVKLFNIPLSTDKTVATKQLDEITYRVRRGKSILYDLFKIYREVKLLEDSILLSRVTRSALLRIIQVEVGDMAKPQVHQLLSRIKAVFEQKTALDAGVGMAEYNNPGPVENNIYQPTRGGLGGITSSTLGGDYNVGQLTDLEHWTNKLFAGLKTPKQFLGFTDDAAGFSGGESLMRINSNYANTVKRIKNAYIQGVKTLINMFLVDKGLLSYVNKFTIKMVSPSTTEDVERVGIQQTKLGVISDIMNLLGDITNPTKKLELVKALLSETVTNENFLHILQEVIKESAQETLEEGSEEVSEEGITSTSTREIPKTSQPEPTTPEPTTIRDELDFEEEDELPSPQDLGVDLADNEAIGNEIGEE